MLPIASRWGFLADNQIKIASPQRHRTAEKTIDKNYSLVVTVFLCGNLMF